MDPIYKQVFIFWLSTGGILALIGLGFYTGNFSKKAKFKPWAMILSISGILIALVTVVNYIIKR